MDSVSGGVFSVQPANSDMRLINAVDQFPGALSGSMELKDTASSGLGGGV